MGPPYSLIIDKLKGWVDFSSHITLLERVKLAYRKRSAEGGTPVHPLTAYGHKSASGLAGLSVHMYKSGLLTAHLTV